MKAPLVFRGGLSDGPSRRDEEYHTYSTSGELVDTVGMFPGPDQFIKMGSSGDQRVVEVIPMPFARRPAVAVHGDHFLFGSGDTYEIEYRAKDGTLEKLIRRVVTPRAVTSEDVDLYVSRQLAEMDDEDDRREMRSTYAEMPVPETMPAYGDLKVDDAGNMWVREFDADLDHGRLWTVFDTEGRMLGSVAMPAGLRPGHIGDDFIVGTWRDELDVEHVRLHELLKP